MKIAQIITELKPSGPANVVKNIVDNLPTDVESTVFYFRGPPTLEVSCETRPIDFRSIKALKSFDVVHSHGIRPDFLGVFASFFNKKSVFISTLHNYVKDELLNIYGQKAATLVTPLWMNAWRRMDGLAVLTQDAYNYYYSSLPVEKLHVVHNGIRGLATTHGLSSDDLDRIEIFSRQYHVLGTNAHLIKRKGISQVVSALSGLPECALVVIGDGPYKKDLMDQAEEAGVADRCWFAGYRDNVSAFLPYYDIYMMPSISEGFGLALLEAMAAGLPCVCSDIGVFREILQKDEAAFFTVGDQASLQSAITHALDQRHQLSTRSRNRYLAQFTGEAMSQNYKALYENIMSKKGKMANL
ncbi:Glycosyltransferase involved in cell wall bisynthesis [Kushneria avicenniae]|uniref:Glycosyltransferase involved in cell wall bisynthesis n=1 Tax=Kushneria avicenniae TaxID=402385 RepID=A0A1I1N610_9GAMM|nr:glycosyltransferase [Kushneria avicenniae]SFC90938.1 Glycosyltransferase involved in cell wall bisynthesis [Kushneria avicenniae]